MHFATLKFQDKFIGEKYRVYKGLGPVMGFSLSRNATLSREGQKEYACILLGRILVLENT